MKEARLKVYILHDSIHMKSPKRAYVEKRRLVVTWDWVRNAD